MENELGRLLVFSKAPVAGAVKTRLIPALGAEGAAHLHEELLTICLKKVIAINDVAVELWCAPDTNHPYFKAQNSSLYKQEGETLGERMAYALEEALTRCKQALLLGTDSPALATETLIFGLQSLKSGYDAVIVPAEDGGYVAIGMRRVDRKLFEGIEWGSDRVYAQTVERFKQLGWRWRALEMCWDIDRPEELVRYEGWKRT
ncbi:MAG: glycosyltransferase [Gammaproteobacteria bacterium]|nr:MAG: glycosyltransferase [Gammaproteobacteria bacterium]